MFTPESAWRVDDFNSTKVIKGPWGRPLTQGAKCNITQTVYLNCTPLLKCWSCESDDVVGCFNTSQMKSVICNEDVLQCYHLKEYDTLGKLKKIVHGCGDDNKNTNYDTCGKFRSDLGCGPNKKCFCNDCYGHHCNASPLYKATAATGNTIIGSLNVIRYLLWTLTSLVRIGKFDISVFDNSSTSSATIDANDDFFINFH